MSAVVHLLVGYKSEGGYPLIFACGATVAESAAVPGSYRMLLEHTTCADCISAAERARRDYEARRNRP